MLRIPKVLKIFLSYWWQIIVLLIGLCLQVFSNLSLPDMMSEIINNGIGRGDIGYIWGAGLKMLGFVAIGIVGMVVSSFFAARIAAGFAAKLRRAVFEQILKFSIKEIDEYSTASLITRTTNDVMTLQQTMVMALRMAFQAPLMAAGAVIMALATAPNMAWIIGMMALVLVVVIITIVMIGLPKFRLTQQLTDKLNQVARENLTGLRVVRAFNNEKYEEQKFQRTNDAVARVTLFTSRLMATMMPIVQFAISGSSLLIVWVGASLVDQSVTGIGEIVAFMQYATQVMMSFMFLAMAFVVIPRALVSGRRVNEVLETKSSIRFKRSTDNKADDRGVEFHNVSFSYKQAEKPVLKGVSFRAAKGETTAIIGSTGSGKSTIVNLIARFYDVTGGKVTLDGVDVRDFTKDDLMTKLGVVPQKAVLFSGTIESNIKYGATNISDQQMKKAAKAACAAEFIEKLEKKYKSPVSQGGTNFSGGQKQRLSIARAIAKSPEVYIFDDSFSALDYKTDRQVRANLKPLVEHAAVIIVAQRVGTIKNADQIIVLDKGKIVGKGKHDELLENCEVYKEIALSQLSKEEL